MYRSLSNSKTNIKTYYESLHNLYKITSYVRIISAILWHNLMKPAAAGIKSNNSHFTTKMQKIMVLCLFLHLPWGHNICNEIMCQPVETTQKKKIGMQIKPFSRWGKIPFDSRAFALERRVMDYKKPKAGFFHEICLAFLLGWSITVNPTTHCTVQRIDIATSLKSQQSS